MASEKHLDAEWKRIQEKTFTRWCNEHLKSKLLKIETFSNDLKDGVKLIVLLELLSQKKLGRYNKKPRVRAQMMENAEVALGFISVKERIRLVNIGAGDIVDGNLKLILGLIWTLILHYQISMGFGLDDQPKGSGLSPKQALLEWINDQLTDRKVKNFTSDWNDGTTIAALVDALAPGLCPEYAIMNPQNKLDNASHAMKLADDWLDVPQVLGPEDMVNPRIDELSMMTYLSQFPDAKLKPGAPISRKKLKKGDPKKVKVFGPGVEKTGLDTNIPAAEFTVDPRGAGDGTVKATVTGPNGPVECTAQLQRNGTHQCSYVPNEEGDYIVDVTHNGYPVGESPYNVNVALGVDSSACTAYGPGLESNDLRAGSPTEFWVETAGAGDGTLSVVVKGPKGSIASKELKIDREEDDKYHVQYMTEEVGPHNIEVTYSGLHIPDSPFKVRINTDRPNAKKCKAEGPGLDQSGVEINKETWFDVHTKGAGRGDLSVHVKSPHGTETINQENVERGLDHFTYTPSQSGEYVISIKYGGDNIPGSRFKVQVEPPTDSSKCVASGPGLAPQGVRVNEPAKFTVRTKDAGHGDVVVKICGPCGDVPYSVESSAYTHNYTYQATEPGDYVVEVTFDGEHIKDSPFAVAITDATKVAITGPGMNGECLPVSCPLVYQVDARNAGPGEVKCSVQDRESLKQSEEQTDSANSPLVTANGDGTFTIEYTPTNPGLQKMNVTFGEASVPNAPIRLSIFDPSQVKAFGPGLEDGNKSGDVASFTVDMRSAGEGELDVSLEGPHNPSVTIKDQANNVVNCEYTADIPGNYVVNVKYGDVHVPNSPFSVNICPHTDPSAVEAYGPGLESGLTTDTWAEFFVDYKKAGDGEPQVIVNGPAGGENVEETQVEDGLKKYRYYIDPDEAGEYKVDITFADNPVPNSPFIVQADWKTDPTRVKAYGPGLDGGQSGEWTEFEVDMTKAGNGGGLDVQIEGPCEAEVNVIDHEDGTATVKYFPKESGEYKINILFAEQPIPESPFVPLFVPETDPSKVKAHGPGLQHDGVKVGDPGDFIIDTRAAGAGAVDVVVDGPYWRGRAPTPLARTPSPGPGSRPGSSRKSRGSIGGATAKSKISSNNDNTYDVVYNPRKVGTYKIEVYFADQTLPSSPYEVNITDPSKVIIKGPGLDENGDKLDEIPVISVSNKDPLAWTIDCTEAGPGVVQAILYGVDGKEKVVQLLEEEEDVYHLSYQPDSTGRHRLLVKYSENVIQQCPIDFSLSDSSLVKVTGPGLAGGQVGPEMVIEVDSSKAGEGGLALSLTGPSHAPMTCDDNQDGTATLRFTPTVPGEYKLDIKFSDEDVPGSIFSIPIIDPSKCTATGSGVTGDGTKVGNPALVYVDTRDSGPAPVSATVKTPSGVSSEIEFTPTEEEGVFVGEYVPDETGVFELEVQFADCPLQDSPYSVSICNPNAVKLSGPGLESAVKDRPNVIDVFTGDAGDGEVGICVVPLNENSPPVETTIKKLDDEHYQIEYIPRDASDIEIDVTYNGFSVDDKRIVAVSDPSKVNVYGPGIEAGVQANTETEFTVDATEAGTGDLNIAIKDADGGEIECTIAELDSNVWNVKYTPDKPGCHKVAVVFAQQPIPESPFQVEVCDPSAVKVYGPGLEKATPNEEARFTVDASKAGEGNLGLKILGPADCEINCEEKDPGVYEVSYIAPRPGVYAVELMFMDTDIPGSPFEVKCNRPPPDASKCIIHGIENPGSFTVDCQNAGGNGLLEVGVCGAYVPVEFVSVKHNGDYTFSISYDISEPGETKISVKWHGQHLSGSPFTVLTE